MFGKVRYVAEKKFAYRDEIIYPEITFFTKTSEQWSNEQEYRYINRNAIDVKKVERKLRFSSRALTNIYYGCAIGEKELQELKDIISRSRYDSLKIEKSSCI